MLRFPCALLILGALLTACNTAGGPSASTTSGVSESSTTPTPIVRRGFLGAFFRSIGPPPFGVFSVYSKQRAPEPYPSPNTKLFGRSGYCDEVAANGVSLTTGYLVDAVKLANIVNLGVKWTRTEVSSNYSDQSHTLGPGNYSFSDFDSAQCALVRHHILPIVGIEAGTIQYNAIPDTYSPGPLPNYKTAADFGAWCGVVATHETKTFASVYRYSEPGNEVNSDSKTYPGGDAEIAAYAQACYRAIKAVQPKAIVYGFELNMDRHIDAPAFVQRMYELGCKLGTCYDAISIHMFMPYPIPANSEPCYPSYSPQCVTAIQDAAHAPGMHILIGEAAFMIPRTVPDEETKAKAVVDAMQRFAAYKLVDGVSYANVDECDLYPSGPFVAGCLIDSLGNKLPAYSALATLAKRDF
jgi:hypothetical protein